MIVTVRYREKADRPDKARIWVYAEKLPPIDAKPEKIRLFRGGFPPGYELEDYRMHLYENGSEIATSASRKQVALTADEAFQVTVVDYPGKNRDQTLGPVPARTFWPADLRARVPAAKQGQTVYLKVGKDGKPLGTFVDKSCTHALADAEIDVVMAELRFYPALASGKPIEGVATVRLE
jgi:hypothetical protein